MTLGITTQLQALRDRDVSEMSVEEMRAWISEAQKGAAPVKRDLTPTQYNANMPPAPSRRSVQQLSVKIWVNGKPQAFPVNESMKTVADMKRAIVGSVGNVAWGSFNLPVCHRVELIGAVAPQEGTKVRRLFVTPSEHGGVRLWGVDGDANDASVVEVEDNPIQPMASGLVDYNIELYTHDEVSLRLPTGKSIRLAVTPATTADDLCREGAAKLGIPVSHFVLQYQQHLYRCGVKHRVQDLRIRPGMEFTGINDLDANAVVSFHVELPDGPAFSSAMPMAATFKDLETAIQKQCGVDMAGMEMAVNHDYPDVGDLLMDFPFTVKVAPRSCIRFFVKTLTGKTLTLRASKFATVAHVKDLIQEAEGYPLDQQRLIFGGKQLEDDRSLASHNITEDATLHVVLRLCGGMYHTTSGRRDLTNLDLPDEELWEFVLPDGTAMFLRSNDQERARDTAARVEACLQLKALADALPTEDGQGQRARITAEMERLGMVAV